MSQTNQIAPKVKEKREEEEKKHTHMGNRGPYLKGSDIGRRQGSRCLGNKAVWVFNNLVLLRNLGELVPIYVLLGGASGTHLTVTPLVGKQEDVLVVEVELIGQMFLMRSGVDVLLKVDWWNRCVRNILPRCTTRLSLSRSVYLLL